MKPQNHSHFHSISPLPPMLRQLNVTYTIAMFLLGSILILPFHQFLWTSEPILVRIYFLIYYYFTRYVPRFSMTPIHRYIISSRNKTKTSLRYSVHVLLREVIQCPIWIINFQLWKPASYTFVLSRHFILCDLTLERQNRSASKQFSSFLRQSLPQIFARFYNRLQHEDKNSASHKALPLTGSAFLLTYDL